MKPGRFVVDAHIHAQRFAAGPKLKESGVLELTGGAQWEALGEAILDLIPYDNSARLLTDMEAYGIDACVLLPAFGMSNEINADLVARHPDRFRALCYPMAFQKRIDAGEEEWSIEARCASSRRCWRRAATSASARGCRTCRTRPTPWSCTIETAIGNCMPIMEVAQRHGVCVKLHTGWAMGYPLTYFTSKGRRGPINLHPLLAHDLASAFPDVTIVFDHGGIQGWWSEKFWEECLHVAAAHDNVYLEMRAVVARAVRTALADPNVGPDKLIWGTDWGASMTFALQPGRDPRPTRCRSAGGLARATWSTTGLELPRDVGAAHRPGRPEPDHGRQRGRVYGLDLPLTRRMFRERRV